MKIGIIIVTYNSQKDIGRLLDSILAQNYDNKVIYIIDNNSSDETLNIVQRYQDRLSLCINSFKENKGFARGNNAGIRQAMEDGCELLFILNPDMQLLDNCLAILSERITRDETIGVIGPVVLYGNKADNIIQVYGVIADFRNQKKSDRFGGKRLTKEIPAENYVDFVLGGAMMIRSSVLKTTGLFEEDYFMYNDEIDISYRIKKAGFKTLCVRDAVVRHFHDFSKKNKSGHNLMYYYIMRNRYLYYRKFGLYSNLTWSLLTEIINIPFKVIWALRRMGGIRILKFYYAGMFDGLQGKKGQSDKSFEHTSKPKKIILTADYELFLGEETGSVRECMIEPTEKIIAALEKNGSKLTIYWDILHYYRLVELSGTYPELEQDKLLIEDQIIDLARKGHDIQLHLHPHWLDARYENGKWSFVYDKFKLHRLSDRNNSEDINTIIGCVTMSKKLMEQVVRKINPDYEVIAYRAGGYLIEPFQEIKDALFHNNIRIDSSVCPEFYNDNKIFSFDFRNYPSKVKYNFDISPKEIENTGKFTELPIATIKIPAFINIFFTLIRMFKYPHLESERKGTSAGAYFNSEKAYFKKLFSFTHERINQLTTDNSFKERFSYSIKKMPDYSTMILHPKLMNLHMLETINHFISDDKVHFVSVSEYMKENTVNSSVQASEC